MYTTLNSGHITALAGITGEAHCHLDDDTRKAFGSDYTEDLSFPPDVVVAPANTSEVSAIMRYCHEHCIPITPIGALTGLSGGALSVYGGVGLSLRRMNRILEIDTDNHQVITQPSVIVQELQEAVEEHGLYYAPDPASRGSSFIGGNLAENSGGPRAVKYGVTKDWVLNLEVVLPNGEVIRTGANTLKNSTGYNLTQLMVGSEGTLGVITEATLKLIPKPQNDLLMLVPFPSAESACEAVSAIFKAGITPSALEFMERDAVQFSIDHTDAAAIDLPDDVDAHLLIEVDGKPVNVLMNECETILSVVEAHGSGEVLFADDQAKKDQLWYLRRRVGEAVKQHSIYKEEDTVVPRYALPALLRGVKEIGARYGFQSVCYGHAGDGNLHVNIIKGDLSEEAWNIKLPEAIREIFELVHDLGGTISGEHGIGLVQKEFMDIVFPPSSLELMWSIKKTFDSKLIMNPGKVFPKQFWNSERAEVTSE